LLEKIHAEGPIDEMTHQLNIATIKMFTDAAKINDQDAELQTVLGVLHHINRDFQNSISAFTAAVKLQPSNPELWNKLGAAIANGGCHEDATRFYVQALQLRPNYLRAQVNYGTAYYNLGAYHKAYPILNTILTSSDAKLSKTPQPHLWPMLRQSLSMCQLSALADAVMMRDIDLLKKAMQETG
jgi:peroxin-5